MIAIKKIKLTVKRFIRFSKDLLSNDLFRFAKKRTNKIQFDAMIKITQEIKPSETFQNKKFNLALAAKKINDYCIMPNEIFSFWKIVGNPENGFKKGRTLQNGALKEDVAGGICQASGIIYHASLVGGLQILERHNHSVDIYTEETRFAPLGLDATVVFGYKDLRIKNSFTFPIKFEIMIHENQIEINLLAPQKIENIELFFESESDDECTFVRVLDQKKKVLNSSKYRKKDGLMR